MGRRSIGSSSRSRCFPPLALKKRCPTNRTIVRFSFRSLNQVDLKKVSQGFHGQPGYEEPTETDGINIANRHLEAKARHSGAWTYALVARDVETLWLCGAARLSTP
eukprot:1062230-Amphidinium_carterae.1